MIDLKDIPEIIRRSGKNLQVVSVFDFSRSEWLVDAVPDLRKLSEDTVFYLVSKTNGSIRTFIPTQDLDTFSKAQKHRVAGI